MSNTGKYYAAGSDRDIPLDAQTVEAALLEAAAAGPWSDDDWFGIHESESDVMVAKGGWE